MMLQTGRLNKMKKTYSILFLLLFTLSVFAGEAVNMQAHFSGLIASYSLDTTSMQSATTIADGSGYGNTGTITAGASSWFEVNQRGVANNALDFDGADTKIDCGSDFIGTQAISVSAWIYMVGAGEEAAGRIIDNGKTQIYWRNDLSKFIIYREGGASGGAISGVVSPLNTWLHLIVTSTNTSVTNFYINGVLSGTANQDKADPIAGTTNVIIGNINDQTRTFDGRISDFRIYNEVKSATWALEDYKLYRPAVTLQNHYSGLIASYSLDTTSMKSATVIADLSGYGNHGTITAGASSWFEADQRGVANSAMDFDGANTKISLNTNNYLVNTDFTITAWVKCTEDDGTFAIIYSTSNIIAASSNGIYFGKLDNGYWYLEIDDGVTRGGWALTSTNMGFTSGTWKHFCGTFNKTTGQLILYGNGIYKGQSTNASLNYNIDDISPLIGEYGTTGSNGLMQLADLRIYKEFKSATWIWEDFQLYKPAFIVGN